VLWKLIRVIIVTVLHYRVCILLQFVSFCAIRRKNIMKKKYGIFVYTLYVRILYIQF
jgi:hypothetical protein